MGDLSEIRPLVRRSNPCQACIALRARPATWVARVSPPSIPAEGVLSRPPPFLCGTFPPSALPPGTFRLTSPALPLRSPTPRGGFETRPLDRGWVPFGYVDRVHKRFDVRRHRPRTNRKNAASHAWRTRIRELCSRDGRLQTRTRRPDAQKRVHGDQERSWRDLDHGAPWGWERRQ